MEQRADWHGYGQWATVKGTVTGTPSGAPTGLVLASGNAKLVAGWSPPEGNGGADVTAYTVQYKTSGAADQTAISGDPATGWVDAGHGGTGTDTEITGLTNGVGYDVRVRASNSKNYGPWSDTASATPAGAPGAPIDLVLALDNAKLVAGWNPPEDNGGAVITAYAVQYKTTGATNLASVLDDPHTGWVDAGHSGTGTDTEITGLTNGVGYDVRVRASNSEGDGQWSDTASAAPHEDVIWSAILTVDVDNDYGDGAGTFGCVIDVLNSSMDECPEALTEDEFAFGLDAYGWTQFSRYVSNDGTPARSTTVGLSALVPDDSNLRKGKIQIGSEVVSLDDASRVQWFVPDPDTYRNMQWIYSGFLLHDDTSMGLKWSEGQRVPLSLQARLPQVQVTDETPPGLSGNIPDPNLSALTVSDGSSDVLLTPEFAPDTAGYTAGVDNSVSSVTVTPTVKDSHATVTVGGATVTSGTPSYAIALTAGVAEVIEVVVTAHGLPDNTYTVTVTRAKSSDATLSALTVSNGSSDVPLTPEFAPDTAGYTAGVDNSVNSVTVTPTVNDANATVTVEGSAVTSGTASSAIALSAGDPEVIDVVVTAQDGIASTYTVTVKRENENTNPPEETQDSGGGQIIELCQRLYTGDIEGLRVCVTPYEGAEAILMLTLPGARRLPTARS